MEIHKLTCPLGFFSLELSKLNSWTFDRESFVRDFTELVKSCAESAEISAPESTKNRREVSFL